MFALDGVDVLTLENGAAGPFCTRLLGDLGADVVKVERPGVGDVHRQWDSVVFGDSSTHAFLDRNKRSVELDLKSEEDRELFRELAAKADVVVQNFSPGVVDRLDVAYDDLARLDDGLIYLNISGYGRTGPYSDRKAYDLIMQGETGLVLMNGSPDAPAKIPISICDINAAVYGVIGILTALIHRERTGEGQEINVSMFAGMLSWLGYFPFKYWYNDELPERMGMRHHLLVPYGPYQASDGSYVNLAVLSDDHWRRFCEDVIERPELVDDERFERNVDRVEHRAELEALVEEEIGSEPTDVWTSRLEEAGIPWGNVNRLDEVLDHPQTEALDMIKEVDVDGNSVKFIDHPIDFGTLEVQRKPFPDLGEHTEEVLSELDASDR